MAQRLIRILRPIRFQGSKHASGVDSYLEPELAVAITAEVALALQMCNDKLASLSMLPLCLTVAGHTSATLTSADESRRISSLRALQVERSLELALRAAAPAGASVLWGADISSIISHHGFGSSQPLAGFDDGGNHAENRRVEMRLVAPGEPGYMSGLASMDNSRTKQGGKPPPRGPLAPRLTPQQQKERRDEETAGSAHSVHLKLEWDPAYPIPLHEQMRTQMRRYGLRVRELFKSLDAEGGGNLSRDDWRAALRVYGPNLPTEVLDAAFDEAMATSSTTTTASGGVAGIGFGELDAYLNRRSRPAATSTTVSPANLKKTSAASSSKPPTAVVPRVPSTRAPPARVLPAARQASSGQAQIAQQKGGRTRVEV